jgi:hypothetical protein
MVGAFVALAPTDAHAITYTFDNSNGGVTAGVYFVLWGGQMDGMKVTVYFSGGGQETKYWAKGDFPYCCGGAFGTGWGLGLSGDSDSNTWSFFGTAAIDRLVLSGGWGAEPFGVIGTSTVFWAGSSRWQCYGFPGCQDAQVTYRQRVNVLYPPWMTGYLYRIVDVSFSHPLDRFEFGQPALNVAGTPEPGTLLLLGSGVSALALRRRRNS